MVDGVRSGSVTYHLGPKSWRQDFDAIDLDDGLLSAEADEVGRAPDGALDDEGKWVRLRPKDKTDEANRTGNGGSHASSDGGGAS